MPIHMDKIRDFLRLVEGPQQTQGYIPCNLVGGGTANYKGGANPESHNPMGVSGVTIATGVDLGQTTADTLRRIGVSAGTVNALMPYFGKRKAEAVAVLHRLPLSVTREVAEELDAAMHQHHGKLIEARYDKDAGAGAFASLPWQAQTAIYSILYQRGTASPRKFAFTWAAFVRRDWKDAAARLCNANLWEGYQGRRRQEGELLRALRDGMGYYETVKS